VLASEGAERPVDFNRDVRPILSNHCFACHGPDEEKRAAHLRLDTPEGLRATLPSGAHAVVPGDLDASELAYRIAPALEGDLMPPASFGKPLKAEQVELLTRWVREGAEWRNHWSFVPPTRPVTALPEDDVAGPAEPTGDRALSGGAAIDAYVRAALVARGLAPAAEADPTTLLRRVTLDLTGLPPTLDELDNFLADTAPDAYERAVERLLASPRYGEHMARIWLDAARYADTHGLHLDNVRSMWPYRDWVVRALNDNLPFDEFTVWQLAGDLLPEPTADQLIASGFNRCNPTSAEGGMIAEEYLSIYAKDRVDTMATIWLGVTMNCAQCHDHKYDPFTQRDYYELYAFFASLAEEASDRNVANPAPFLAVPTADDRARLVSMNSELAQLEAELSAPNPALDAAESKWATERGAELARRWLTWLPETAEATHGATLTVAPDGSIVAGGENPHQTVYELRGWVPPGRIERLRLEALLPSEDARLPGRATNQNFVLSGLDLAAAPAGSEAFAKVELTRAVASYSQENWPVEAIVDDSAQTGWAGLGLDGARRAEVVPRAPFGFDGGTELRFRLRFESAHQQHALARFRVALDHSAGAGVGFGVWQRAFVADDNARTAHERELPIEAILGALDVLHLPDPRLPEERIATSRAAFAWTPEPGWTDGEVWTFEERIGSMVLVRSIWSDVPRRMEATLGSDDSVQVWVNGALVHDNPAARGITPNADRITFDLRAGSNVLVVEVSNHGGGFAFEFLPLMALPFEESAELALALTAHGDAATPSTRALVQRSYRSRFAPEWVALKETHGARLSQRNDLEAGFPTTLVARDLAMPRATNVLVRGAYDKRGAEVTPDVPAVLPPLPKDAPRNRLTLARWLVDSAHPLTARVTVNRVWQHFFGRGLVATPEDFGAQGAFPTHPELLDHLAVEFVESGWDVKALHHALVTTATYRQRAHVTREALTNDPQNRFLARASRVRLDAEVLRDQALAVSGLLDEAMGGPGVRPYQPEGVWEAVAYTGSNTAKYQRGPSAELFRRSLYTFWKRTAPPPALTVFDAPSREACTVVRERTNTPLQALAALNETTQVEAARHLAALVLAHEDASDEARLGLLFRSVTARAPTADELPVLARTLGALRAEFGGAPERARALLAVGETEVPATTSDARASEWAAWALLSSVVFNLDEVLVRG